MRNAKCGGGGTAFERGLQRTAKDGHTGKLALDSAKRSQVSRRNDDRKLQCSLCIG